MDGGNGALLKGNGDGDFSEVRADQSGIVIPGDAKAVVLSDLNGDARPDLMVAMNGSEALAFEQAPPAGTRVLTVELKAPDALKVGSFLQLELDSGRQLSTEIYAGGGYLSQSSAITRFIIPKEEQATKLKVRWSNGEVATRNVIEGPSKLSIKSLNQ